MESTLVVVKEPLRNQFEKLKAEETNGEAVGSADSHLAISPEDMPKEHDFVFEGIGINEVDSRGNAKSWPSLSIELERSPR